MFGDEANSEAITARDPLCRGRAGDWRGRCGSRKGRAAAVLAVGRTMVVMRSSMVVRTIILRERVLRPEIAQADRGGRHGAKRQKEEHQQEDSDFQGPAHDHDANTIALPIHEPCRRATADCRESATERKPSVPRTRRRAEKALRPLRSGFQFLFEALPAQAAAPRGGRERRQRRAPALGLVLAAMKRRAAGGAARVKTLRGIRNRQDEPWPFSGRASVA